MPDLAGATGGETIASEAAMPCVSAPLLLLVGGCGRGGVLRPEEVGDLDSPSLVMVDWEEERENVFARGAR